MKDILIAAVLISISNTSWAAEEEGLPFCTAELNDPFSFTVVAKTEWREDFFIGEIEGATQTVLITTSLGYDQIMSLWVREKRQSNQAGMFSFVDLSSGKPQYLRFYMADGYSVGVTCQWDARS